MSVTPFPTARATDPHTSHEAAEARRPHLRTQVHAAVCALEQHQVGATAWEVTRYLADCGIHVQQNSVSKRLGELETQGLLVRTEATRPGGYGSACSIYRSSAA